MCWEGRVARSVWYVSIVFTLLQCVCWGTVQVWREKGGGIDLA